MDAGHWGLLVAAAIGWLAYYRVRGRPDPPRQGVTVEEWRERLARLRRE